jgi:hypothetical protein
MTVFEDGVARNRVFPWSFDVDGTLVCAGRAK